MSIAPSMSRGSARNQLTRAQAPASAGFWPSQHGDLPLLDGGRRAKDLRHALAQGADGIRGSVHGVLISPGGGDDAAAGLTVGQHRQPDVALHLLYAGEDVLPHDADPLVYRRWPCPDSGGSCVHANQLPVLPRRRRSMRHRWANDARV